MQVARISDFRKNIKKYMEDVVDNKEALIVNGNGKTVVVVSLDKYNEMDETTYLMSTKANKKRLLNSIKQADEGKLIKYSLKKKA